MPSGFHNLRISDKDFIKDFPELGVTAFAKKYNLQVRGVAARRRHIESKYNIRLSAPSGNHGFISPTKTYPHRSEWAIPNGEVIIASDLHLWPAQESKMLKALKHLCAELKPKGLILNGDVLDFARISRHPPIGWESSPTPQQEIEAAQDHLAELVRSTGRAKRSWNLGNHDARFETRIATVAPEYAKIAGVHLSDHFPGFDKGWSTWINGDVVVKHRFKGGMHATFNNTKDAGKTMVTGHLHSAQVRPFTDYNGTRWGVDTGCIAETDAKQFVDYTEDNPKNWISAFCVLTFRDKKLMWPELVTPWSDTHVQFRGEIIKV